MSGGPSIIRRPASEKSNIELINSLRLNIDASKQAFKPVTNGSIHLENNEVAYTKTNMTPFTTWTTRDGDVIYIPSVDFSQSQLAEERSDYDVTVKLFFLPDTSAPIRAKHTEEAVSMVLKELHISSIDLLIGSFAGVSFDADDEEDPESSEEGTGRAIEDTENIIETWRAFEKLHGEGVVLQIGLAEFGSERLKKFLPRTKVRPSVDQINVRDCCVVPRSLILYAKQENIELLTHNDCTNILPPGTVRELLGSGENGAGVLAGPEEGSQGLKGEVEPQWVVKYTAVVRDRGVIENKGYFAMAELRD
jgi:glutamate--cysteine ligase regulatory subunit